jgi:hypothetical protein
MPTGRWAGEEPDRVAALSPTTSQVLPESSGCSSIVSGRRSSSSTSGMPGRPHREPKQRRRQLRLSRSASSCLAQFGPTDRLPLQGAFKDKILRFLVREFSETGAHKLAAGESWAGKHLEEHMIDILITSKTAEEVLALPYGALAKMRLEDKGPPYHKLGNRIRYKVGDLNTWLQSIRFPGERSSTSPSTDIDG